MKQECVINTVVHEKGFFRLPRRHEESWAFCWSIGRDPSRHRLLQDYRKRGWLS